MTRKKGKLDVHDILSKVSRPEGEAPPDKTRDKPSGEQRKPSRGGFSAKHTLLEGREGKKLDAHVDNVRNIDPSLIRVSEANARLQPLLTDESLADLVESIRIHGQIEPAEVFPLPEDEISEDDSPRYELISGSRRLAAVTKLDRPLRAVVYDNPDWDLGSPQTALAIIARSRAENETLRPSQYEYAQALARSMARWPDLTQTQVAEALGLSRGSISSLLKYAEFPLEAAQALGEKTIRSLKPQVGARWTREWDTDKLVGLIRDLREKHPGATGSKLINLIDEQIRSGGKPTPKKTAPKWKSLPSGGQWRSDVRKGRLHFEVKLQRNVKDPDRTLEEVAEEVKKRLKSDT